MRNKTAVLSTVLCLAPILLGLALYDQLPEMVPTHFDMNGVANGWSSRPVAVFGMPALMAVVNLICHGATMALRKNETEKIAPEIMFATVYWLLPVLSNILVPMSLFMGLGMEMPIGIICCLLVGVLFIVIGNYLPKCRPNRYMGIKLPWTYASEENWWKTHRFGGKVWVVCGFAMITAGVFELDWLLLIAVFGSLILPCGYSYLEFRREIGR